MEQEIVFSGLDLDNDLHKLQPGSYVAALNIRIRSAEGENSHGIVEDVEGNSLVSFALPAGVSKVIGAFENGVERSMFIFLYNANSHHTILRYDYNTGQIITTLQTSLLNFNAEKRVLGIGIIGNLLYFSDDYNQPRMLNYVRAEAGEYADAIAAADKYVLNLIRRPPLFPLRLNLDQLSSVTKNRVAKGSYQFTYRYVYRDHQRSVLAPISKIVPYSVQGLGCTLRTIGTAPVEGVPFYLANVGGYNAIRVLLPADEVARLNLEISAVEFFVRKGNTGNFGLIKTIKKELGEDFLPAHEFMFLDDVLPISLAESEEVKQFENVPLIAGDLEVLDGRVFVGDYLEGYPNPKVNMTVVMERDSANLDGPYTIYQQTVWVPERQTGTTELIRFRVFPGGYLRVVYDSATNTFKDSGSVFSTFRNDQAGNPQPVDITDVVTTTASRVLPPAVGSRIFKSGARYRVGIQFVDEAGRTNGAVHDDSWIVESDPDFNPFEPNQIQKIRWNLTGITPAAEIPVWAAAYKILLSKNIERSFFVQGLARDIYHLEKIDDQGNPVYTRIKPTGAWPKETYIDISALVDAGMGYTFNEGDRIRIYIPDPTTGRFVDVPIKGTRGDKVIVDELELFSEWPFDKIENIALIAHFEIYTPFKETTFPDLWEVAFSYPVLNPGTPERDYAENTGLIEGDVYFQGRHFYFWQIRDEAITTRQRGGRRIDRVALSDAPSGTIYYSPNDPATKKLSSLSELYFFESMSPWDEHYSETCTDHGRAIPVDPNAASVRYRSNGRFSNPYVLNTAMNAASEFEALNYWTQPAELGAISKLISTGNVLVSLQELGGRSIYIGQQQISDAQGQTLISVSNKVVGSQQPFVNQSGTTVRESVQTDGHDVYWLDVQNAQVMRKAGNGVHSISRPSQPGNPGISTYIARKCREILEGNVFVSSGFDPRTKEYILTIGAETLTFCTESGRFKGHYSFVPEAFGRCADRFFTFKDGATWIHNSATRHNFFGQQYPAYIETICNAGGTLEKLFLTVKQKANRIWHAPRITTPGGQESNLIDQDFEASDGWNHAAFLMDQNTPNIENPLIEGDQLRSSILRIRLQVDGTNRKATLTRVVVQFAPA